MDGDTKFFLLGALLILVALRAAASVLIIQMEDDNALTWIYLVICISTIIWIFRERLKLY